MKQLSIVLNVVLLIAVAVLYYFHFKEHKEKAIMAPGAETPIVYINSETLTDNYKLYIQKREELQAEQEQIKRQLAAEGSRLQGQIENYQKNAGTMSKVERDATEQKLARAQEELYIKRDSLTAGLQDKKDLLNEQIYDHLTAYIKDYLKEKGRNYHFILGYQKGGGIVFANDSLDITKEILDGLNKEYDKENPLGK